MAFLIAGVIVALTLGDLVTAMAVQRLLNDIKRGDYADAGTLLGLCAACEPSHGAQAIQRSPDGLTLCAFHARQARRTTAKLCRYCRRFCGRDAKRGICGKCWALGEAA